MARIRSIKPAFFDDEDIARLPSLFRLAFIGLWCQADKAGRLEDRPTRLKVNVLPYDDVNFVEVLDALVAARFVQRYTGPDGRAYLQIRSFEKHQRTRQDEPESELPSPPPVTDTDPSPALLSDATVPPERLGKERNWKGTGKEGSTPTLSAREVVEIWNATVTAPIPRVDKLTSDRKAKIDARIRTFPSADDWRAAIAWCNTQAWMRAPGTGDHPNWTVTIDWLCKNDGNIQRCLERSRTAVPPAARSWDRTGEPWVCPHLVECSNARICANATACNKPRKPEVAAS